VVKFSHHKPKAGSDFLYIIVRSTYNGIVVVSAVISVLHYACGGGWVLLCLGWNFKCGILASTLMNQGLPAVVMVVISLISLFLL